jgi:biopolymer transport protein TolR
MGMSTGGGSKEGMNEINVTPLIDIMLVMLIIFMVITPPTLSQMQAKLPDKTETMDQPEDVPEQQLVAAVCEDGTVALNRSVMPLDELAAEVERRLRGKKTKVVFVDGHPEAPYDKVVELMDRVKESGAEKLGLATLKDPAEFVACTPAAAAPAEAPPAAPPG